MRTELFPGGIAPSDHEVAISRLESFGRDLRSPNPPSRFNPLNFRGIESLRVAARNLEVQRGIGKSVQVVQERLEASQRFIALQSIEHDPEPKIFDRFSVDDLSHLLFFYRAFYQNIGRVLGSDVLPIEDIKVLATKHEEPVPKFPPSRAIISQKRDNVIEKLQDWLVDPRIDQIMEDLLPTDNEGDDLWLFMDSIKSLDGQLGLKHKTNIRDFLKQNLEALGSHTYGVDFSKRGHGVVQTKDRLKADSSGKSVLESEIDSSETEFLSSSGTVIFQQASVEFNQTGVESTTTNIKAIEQRDPDIRKKLQEYLEDVLGRPEFTAPVRSDGVNRVFNRLKATVVRGLIENRSVQVEIDREGHPRFDSVAVATVLYLVDHKQLPSRLKKQVQAIAADEYRKRQEESK